MTSGSTVTCTCGSHGFIIVDAATGKEVDLKTYYSTIRRQSINPANLKSHSPLDIHAIKMVCANPRCRRVL